MNFAELLEFHPVAAVRLLELTCLVAVVLFAVIFRKIFEKISGKFLIGFFFLSRITDAVPTYLNLKTLNYDFSPEANLLLRWILTDNYLLSCTAVILFYNLLMFLFIYLFYKRCYNYSDITRFTIKTALLTFSLLGTFFSLSNFLNL